MAAPWCARERSRRQLREPSAVTTGEPARLPTPCSRLVLSAVVLSLTATCVRSVAPMSLVCGRTLRICRAAHVISRAIRTTAAPQRDRAADVGTLPLDKRSSQHRRPETGGSHDRSRTARATTTSPSDSRNARQRARPGRRYCSTPPATTLAASLLFGQVGSVSGWLRCSRSSRSD
jgi:hypothetical protein